MKEQIQPAKGAPLFNNTGRVEATGTLPFC